MDKPRTDGTTTPEEEPSHYIYDSTTPNGAVKDLTAALTDVHAFKQSNPGYDGPFRCHIDLNLTADPERRPETAPDQPTD